MWAMYGRYVASCSLRCVGTDANDRLSDRFRGMPYFLQVP